MGDPATPLSRVYAGVTIPVPGVYQIDPVHTFVDFDVRHLVVGRVRGRFDSFAGEFTVVEEPEQLFGDFEVRFEAASVDTKVKVRDEDLRSPRFFEVATFPTITLRGVDGHHADENRWTLNGQLTIRGVSRPVSLLATVRGVALDGHGQNKLALTIATELRRSDFGLTTELIQESGPNETSPDVIVNAAVEATLRQGSII